MAPRRSDCLFAPPPIITSFYVADIGDNYAILQWFTTTTRQKYSFEIDYQIADSSDNDVSQKRVLSYSQKLVMLKDLKSATNYSSSIFSYNNCGKSSISNLTFETKTKILHPALTHVMPHEVILCLIVLLIWVVILRHFFVVYNRLAFVSPLSLGGYLTRKHQPHDSSNHHHRSTATSRTSSRHTLISKSSGLGTKFNLLENAVNTWRSETVLNGGNGIRRLSDNSSMPYLIPSNKTSHYSNLSHPTHSHRAASNNSLFTGTTRSSFSGPQIFLTTTSKPNSRRPSDSYQQILPPIVDDQSLYSCPPEMSSSNEEEVSSSLQSATTVPLFEPLQNCSFDSDDTQILNDTATSKSGSSIIGASTARKVSEVLLGKATRDIRRCSSYSTEAAAAAVGNGKPKEPLKRRKTLLPYFTNFRNSFKKKKCQMEALKEEREATPVAADYQNWKNQIRKQKQESRALLSTPISMHPSLTTENSFESYVTASDVIIKIDSDDE